MPASFSSYKLLFGRPVRIQLGQGEIIRGRASCQLTPASWGFKSCYVVFELYVFTDCKELSITKRKALYKCILLLLLLLRGQNVFLL